MKGKKFLSYWSGIVVLLILGACCTRGAYAQNTNSGDIRGTVTDKTGALIPNVKVTVLNIDTGVPKEFVTNQDGLYDTSSILPGSYKVTFTKQGFETLVRGPVTLNIGYITVDATLNVGSTSEQVIVSTDVPLLQTESGSQTTTLESQTLTKLPLVNEDFANFMILMPGATGSASNAPTTTNPGMVAAVNGNLPYTNILNDGVSMVAAHSDNVSTVGVMDSVGELQISESTFSAQYGVGGLVVSKITKSGTNKFHGDAYEYLRNDFFNSRQHSYSGPASPVPLLRYDDFGGSIGGPILKKKMFFFFNYDQILNHGAANTSLQTVPTDGTDSTPNIMGGDFSSITRTLYDPTTQTIAYDSLDNPYPVRQSFASEYGNGNVIPSGMLDSVAKAAQSYYPTPSNHPSFGTFEAGKTDPSNGVLTQNWSTQLANSNPFKNYTARLDYDITPNNRLTFSMWLQRNPTPNLSNLTACPLGCQFGFANEDTYQVSDVWNISPSIINEARMGYTYAISDYPDSALNQGFAAKVGWQFGKADQFPSISTSPYSGIGPASNSDYKQGNFDPSDVVTMIRGKNVLHFGGELLFFREDDTNWGNINAGQMSFDGRYTEHWSVSSANCPASAPTGSTCAAPDSGTTGLGYADFLLGLANSWNAAVSPEYGARMKNPEMFVQDDYKMRPNLTINIGLRYDISHGWNEIHGNEMLFDPTVSNPADGLGALWFGTTKANGRSSLQADVFSTVLPRVGFSWQPWANTTVRGGFGVYDHIMTLDDYSVGLGNALASSGNLNDTTSGIYPIVQLDGKGAVCSTTTASGLDCSTGPALPYVSANNNPAALNGQSVGYSPYHTPIQKVNEYNFAIQRQLRTNLVAQVSYVGSHSWNLPVSSDINAVPESKLSANDTADRPYPLFGNLSSSTASVDGVANYNSLQAEITQRVSSGLSFSFNYVWSHFLDDADSAGWCCQAGAGTYQVPNNSAANYSNSNFDIRHAFKGFAIYELPFGKGRQFLNNSSLADAVVGGWQISGSMAALSGSPFSVLADGNTYNQASGSSQFPNWNSGVSWKPAHRTADEWFNPAAFTKPANGTYGNVRRNSLYGPAWYQVNLSGSKTFSLPWEGVKFQVRIDSFNALNHTSWATPGSGSGVVSLESPAGATAGTVYTGPTVSQIGSSTVSGRTVQLGGRLSF